VTSRRARRRARRRVTVATRPAVPGRELERRGASKLEPATAAASMALVAETPEALAHRLEVEHEQARVQAQVLELPNAGRLAGWGVPAVRAATEVQMPAELRRDLVLGAGQVHGCYERCLWFSLRHADVEGLALHHGVVVEGEPARAWPHAWCWLPGDDRYPSGVVFEPAVSRFYEATSWRDALQAVSLHAYSATEAAERCQDEGPPGPWAEHNRALEVLAAERLAELAAEHPKLSRWFGDMLERDPSFARHVAGRRAEPGGGRAPARGLRRRADPVDRPRSRRPVRSHLQRIPVKGETRMGLGKATTALSKAIEAEMRVGGGLSNAEAAAEVGKVLGGAALATGAAAAPVVGAALVANQALRALRGGTAERGRRWPGRPVQGGGASTGAPGSGACRQGGAGAGPAVTPAEQQRARLGQRGGLVQCRRSVSPRCRATMSVYSSVVRSASPMPSSPSTRRTAARAFSSSV
jgi:hypothetical protein